MQINLQSKNIELTEAVKEYAEKRITNLEKLLATMEGEQGEARVYIEVVRTTRHHRSGDIFHASCRINVNGRDYYTESDNSDLNSAIDEVKDDMYEEINKDKDRKQTLFRRGAASVKKMLKGLSRRNPFTSKY